MSNRVYESFLKSGLPKRPDGKAYSPTAYNCYKTILYRYNEETGTSYPGLSCLMLSTGKGKSSVMRAIKELRDGRIIITVKDGHRNQRAEYRPIYTLSLLDSVPLARPISLDKESHLSTESVLPVVIKGLNRELKGSALSDTISTISKYKYDKERFDYVILNNTPKELKDAVTPGANLENLLDELERHGTSREAVGASLNALNWSGVNQPGGFIVKALSTLLSQRKEINLERIAQRTASDNYQAERDKAERDKTDPGKVSTIIEKVRTDLIAKRTQLEA